MVQISKQTWEDMSLLGALNEETLIPNGTNIQTL